MPTYKVFLSITENRSGLEYKELITNVYGVFVCK